MNSTPKGNNSLISSSQSKPALDNQQNSANSTPSQTKGKKRERGDHCSDPMKRERSSKTDDGDSASVKIENISRSEAAKLIIEKGCLVGSESVEKLVEFIQLNRMDKKLDLVSRSMVAGVIAATDRFDCLSHFVQLKGLAVLDEWLQDVHNSRIGELSVSKDGEKPVEEFLLVLLRALDKLPVNLHALQTCNIGRSVNRLRSHRNSDIQRKARILVDIWKKRVEAEMNVLDAKSGSNHGSRNSIGSYDVSLKSSVTQESGSNSKTVLNKASMEETTTKSICSSSGTVKAPPEKEAQPRTGPYSGSDVPLSGQESNNSSHSFPGQEETRITTGVMNASKNSSGSSRHQRSSNGFFGTSESPKEILGKHNSINRNAAVEKLLPSSPSCEKTFEVPVVETSSHKLIVKIPNRIEPAHGSPAKCTSGASFDDHSVISSRGSSLVLSNILIESYDHKDLPIESNDHKDLPIESNDPGKFSAAPDEDSEKSKVPCSSLENDLKDKQFRESSTSALNTLIESCAKYSESNAPISSSGDDVGMNLLASVATREMSASGGVSPADSTLGGTIQIEKKCPGDDSKSKASAGDNHVTDRSPMASESEKQMKVSSDCTEMNEKRDEVTQSKGVTHNMKEPKCSEDNGTRNTSLLDDVSEVKKHQDEIASSSLSIVTNPKKDLHANSNSVEPVGHCFSDKERTNEEHIFSETDGKCGGLCKSEGQKREKKETTTAADEDRDIDGSGKLKRPKLCVTEGGKMEETTTSTIADSAPLSSSGVSRMDFDLNEGFSGHDGKCGQLDDVRLLPNPVYSASVTVASAAKGPFVPPFDLLRNKGEVGWKGSATTSAFRPVEPRKATQMIVAHSNVSMSEEDNTNKPCRVLFDFDLNVADERLLEDMGCQDSSTDIVNNHHHLRNKVNNGPLTINHSGGLDLDLNRVDDINIVPVKSLLSGSLSPTEVKRDFDLNSGPGFDDVVIGGDQSALLPQLSMNSLSPVFGVRQPNSLESRNFSSWLPSGNPYSSVVIRPSNRGEHPFSVVSPNPMAAPQRIVGPSGGGSGGGPFMPDMYRGSLLSHTGQYPYQMFPFGTTLPLPSGTFSVVPDSTSNGRIFNPMAMNSQFLAPGTEISSQYQKKYMLGLHEGSDNRQRFDLNAGPGVPEVESRDDFLAQRQVYVSSSQAVTNSVLRRKEPEAGLDRESLRYKQSSWH